MNFSEFKKKVGLSLEEMCRTYYLENRDHIKIKKEEVAVKNFSSIFYSTLKLSFKKGFQAMSLRDLCAETGLSLGALYSYFSSKDELLRILHEQGDRSVKINLEKFTGGEPDPVKKLKRAIRVHLYMSEIMGLWFYFFFMETKNLSKENRKIPVDSELWTEKLFTDIIRHGIQKGAYHVSNVELLGSSIKALLQDWYLKRWKYRQRGINIDDYADFIISMVESHIKNEKY